MHWAQELLIDVQCSDDSRTANRCIVQWWFKKFCKGEESLKDEERHELTTNQKVIVILKCCLLLFCGKTTWDCDQIVMCNEKWIVYDNQRWLAQWSGWEETPKHFLKPNLHKMRSWSLFRGLLPIRSTTAFEPWQNHYICEVC